MIQHQGDSCSGIRHIHIRSIAPSPVPSMLHFQTGHQPRNSADLASAFSWIPDCRYQQVQYAEGSIPHCQVQVSQQYSMIVTCRTKVEMQAAAASSIRPDSSQDTRVPAGSAPDGETGAKQMPALPRWDCNDGDTWHKRQRVCDTLSGYAAAAVTLWSSDTLSCCCADHCHL